MSVHSPSAPTWTSHAVVLICYYLKYSCSSPFVTFVTKDLIHNILKSSACRLHAHATIPTSMIASMCHLWECRLIRARRFRASLLPHATCVRSWCNWRASFVAAKHLKNTYKVKIFVFDNNIVETNKQTIRCWQFLGQSPTQSYVLNQALLDPTGAGVTVSPWFGFLGFSGTRDTSSHPPWGFITDCICCCVNCTKGFRVTRQ